MCQISGPVPSPPDLRFRIENVTFPGRQINSLEYRSYGPVYKIGYAEQHNEIQLNIILSPNFFEKRYFLRWQDVIVGTGRGVTHERPGTYDIGYYADYIGTITIFQYDTTGKLTYKCNLVDAWPVHVADINADWSNDSIQRLSVTFMYRIFKDEQDGYYDQMMENDFAPWYQNNPATAPEQNDAVSPSAEPEVQPSNGQTTNPNIISA